MFSRLTELRETTGSFKKEFKASSTSGVIVAERAMIGTFGSNPCKSSHVL